MNRPLYFTPIHILSSFIVQLYGTSKQSRHIAQLLRVCGMTIRFAASIYSFNKLCQYKANLFTYVTFHICFYIFFMQCQHMTGSLLDGPEYWQKLSQVIYTKFYVYMYIYIYLRYYFICMHIFFSPIHCAMLLT